MAKKGAKKQAMGWTASAFMEADLKKAKKEGFQAESAKVIDGAMLRHPVGNPKRKVLLSIAANFPQL
jgi:hypothetical protein